MLKKELILIEAVANLKEDLQGYTINIAGEGEENYINELKQLSSKLNVADLIHFIGGVYGNKKWELLKKQIYLYYRHIVKISV